jgi:hypothetical protein
MAFQLFVDPTAGARSAADSIMQGAGAVADSIKERREEKKKERKLFDSYVTQAGALGLGEGETEKERMDDLRTNQTPESLQGMVEGTKLKIYQDMQQANIESTQARTAETKRATAESRRGEGVREEQASANLLATGASTEQTQEKTGILKDQKKVQQDILERTYLHLGKQMKVTDEQAKQMGLSAEHQKKVNDSFAGELALSQEAMREKILTSEATRENEKAKTAIYGINAHTAKMNAGTAQQQAANQKQEQDRLDKINNMPKANLHPAVDSSSGKAIPGLYMTNEGKVVPWESDLANMSPEQSELARLKGALVTLEGMPDDQEVDVDGGNELRDLAPVGWFGGLFSAGEDEAVTVRERVRGKIAELEARRNQSGGVRRYDPSSGQLTTP